MSWPYLLFHPHARVTLLVWIIVLVTFVRVPAWVPLVPYFVLQVPDVQNALSLGESSQGVAVWAHLGGAAAGLLLALPLRALRGGGEPPARRRRGRRKAPVRNETTGTLTARW
ncbi:MAG: rhomboid family intramembrane serine protease [Planctomycetota bacterium]